ncbi:DUF6430 domain-containing protein [Lysobacter sp. S4-A87]|uniref:macro domain-containing protein n=1 Tax=Lysobacter sp. S4-A87 TaxID=2925843 RepID=UPI001F532305|nr:macro domain-containing protein [Lysobacter sp. S4-A87]UNK49903.1 DUF6430 domain-containing protein [Lysobacter sp. S4-A87]
MNELFQDMRTWRFWRHYLIKSFAALGTIVAIVRIVVLFFPAQAHLLGGLAFTIALLLSVLIGLVMTWPRPIECDYSAPATKIKIIKGDIFDQQTHLVVGVTNSFDTETPDIIERTSLLGQTIDRLYGGSWQRLDADLLSALQGKTPIGSIAKDGKRDLYKLGTVATVSSGPRRIFFSAYAQMNAENSASSEIETLTESLFALWTEVIAKGNCRPLAITPWGGGPSRISNVLPAQDSIRLIILSFMFASRKQKVSDELTIVVPKSTFKKLDRMELQAFLYSLRSS